MRQRLVSPVLLAALPLLLSAAPCLAESEGLAKARELVKVMGIEKTLTDHMSDADDIQRSGAFLIDKIAEANPGEESKIGDLLVQEDRSILPQIIPGYVEYIAEMYAVTFTPQELDQLTGFYKSEAMQEVLQKSAESKDVPEMSSDARDQSNAFLQTPTGKKLQQKSPQIMKQINLYGADVIRKKQRDLLYEALRQDLPKNGLKIPDPFAPDTFMDKIIHENTVKANTLPSAEPASKPAQQQIVIQQSNPATAPAATPATSIQQSPPSLAMSPMPGTLPVLLPPNNP